MVELFQHTYRVSSTRVKWHDYDAGIYFVTICTKERKHYFGEIDDCSGTDIDKSKMTFSQLGRYMYEILSDLQHYYSYADVPSFVVMPNHIHAIIIIDGDDTNNAADNISRINGGMTGKHNPMFSNCLGCVVRGLKARISKYAHDNMIPFSWQSRFHDHIVRNQDELNLISDYIQNNVVKWSLDVFYND